MKKDVIVCIGTVGRPTFKKCYEHVVELKKRDPRVKKIVVIENQPSKAAWLNKMREACIGYTWCLQVDEDMYINIDCVDDLLNLARTKEFQGHQILNASGMLKDIFLEENVGSIKLWKTSVLKLYEFRDVMGSDREIYSRAKLKGFSNVSTTKVLGMHDSAPNTEIAFGKYKEYVTKICKFKNIEKASRFVSMLEARYNERRDDISREAYFGARDALCLFSQNENILCENKVKVTESNTSTVSSITPTFFFRLENGYISRSLDRLSAHLRSVKSQKNVDVEMIVVDKTRDADIVCELEKICRSHGAIYKNIETSLVFNKPLLINFGASIASCEHIAILELDMVFRSDMFKKCLDKVNLGASMVNTTVFYSDIQGPFMNCDFDFSLPFEKYSNKGRINPPGENHKGTQGGIQFCRRDFFIKDLKGVNTNINLFGGPDNDTVRRSDKYYKGVVNVCEESNEILAYHIPHDKIRSFGIVDEKVVKAVRSFNQFCAYNMHPDKFVCDEKEVLGLRMENGRIFYGNSKFKIKCEEISSSNIHKISDGRRNRFKV